ncbi:RodZ domain-containing protein [Enterococcus thailandicus]|uniref:helix-turn-helix domain-containing protein n=1 Tax=Enterococcus thailandicus TaxID=417368 RepID=UPI0022DF36EE|nr:RodZ domain-containing protein [Enterococcus thailandicus]
MAFETIGEKLRQARLNKKISLDELQQITKIQKRYLEAIDNDEFDQLPGKFYVRAFIRQYAQAVGEDGDKLVDVFDGKRKLSDGSEIKRPEPETVSGSRKAMHQEEFKPSKFWTSLPVVLLGLVAVAIVIVVGYMTWQDRQAAPIISEASSSMTVDGSIEETKQSSQSSESTSAQSSTVESTTEEKKMTITAGTDTTNAIDVNIIDATEPLTLEFTAKDRVWVGVMVNGAYVYQGTLATGESQSTQIAANVPNAVVTIGAASNIAIKANGEDVPVNAGENNLSPKNVNLAIQYAE